MTKEAVVSQNLQPWVLALMSVECSFSSYWKSLNADSPVQVKYPYERHGLCGKSSNHAKADAKEAFLKFVDNNIQPNGRHAGSYGPQYYFLPQFTRIDPPKAGEVNFERKAKSSVVSEFNRTQTEAGKSNISGFTGRKWLAENRPKVALCPSMTDYCDLCKHLGEQIRRCRTTLDRLCQSGNAAPPRLHEI